MSETKTNTQTTTNSPAWRWRYDPSVEGKRDLRLDFLRGIAICFMSVNHLESHSYFNNLTQGHIYASAAEGFVFLSGFVLGMVTLGRIKKGGWRDYTEKLYKGMRWLADPNQAVFAGFYEETQQPNRAITLNTNGIILEALLYSKVGRPLEVWAHEPH